MFNKVSLFRIPTEIRYGFGVAKTVGEVVSSLGSDKVLIVTDKGVINAGLLEGIEESLKANKISYEIYDEIEPNPSIQTVEKGLEKLKSMEAGVIIAVGGGSSLDTGKTIGFLATNGGKVPDYEGADKIAKFPLPVIGIPTTAGTGSEVTINVVITDRERKYKITVVSPKTACRVALIDPEMTKSMPPKLTASTGMDALTHAIESYTSLMSYPVAATLALESIKLISKNLRLAVFNGDNLQARDNMLMGCLLASMAFNNTRLGNAHAMSHPLSGFFDVPHGVANAILLPHIMEFNAIAQPDRFIEIAKAMGENVDGLTELEAAYKAVEAVKKLSKDVGIPEKLSDVGVKEEAIEDMAKDAMKSGNILVNPRKTNINDVIELYKKAM
ncbi:MAG: hypothetical protein PWQ82_1523 [Thermosediminibacterales bacterium]|nr:hypothetical protein [Thermosediminibacterales bacterium]MDK2836534.1 hypothetical protein [Thermosediminibacterales bacterium]